MNAIGGPTIGLLAGMGVKATAPFLELVIDECQRQYGATRQEEYPQMVIFSWPTPLRFDAEFDSAAFAARVAEGVRWLTRTGVDFIAIPANLPHLYWETLAAEATVPLLNMLDIVSTLVPEGGQVALFAARPTRDSGMYQRKLEPRGTQVVATDLMQETIDGILGDLWSGRDAAIIRSRWEALIRLAMSEGAESALLACTDLNAIPRWSDVAIPIVDATRALAARVVATWVELARERSANVVPGLASQ
jgi:aspartate racemase